MTAGWGIDQELAAVAIEVASSNHTSIMHLQVDAKHQSKIPDPVKVPRPWVEKPKARTAGHDELVSFVRR